MSIRIGHPKLLTLHTLWRSRCAEGLPARRDFDVMEFGPWMGNLQLLEVLDDGTDFQYRLHGIHLVELVGKDLTGRRMTQLRGLGEKLIPEYRKAWRSRKAAYLEKRVAVAKKPVEIKKLILPLATDGQAVDMMMVGIYRA